MAVYISHLDDLTIDGEKYADYLDRWLEGIKSEAQFFKHYMENKTNANWKLLISNERPFLLDEYIDLPETKILDVGSGPFVSCGILTHKTKLQIHAVDALAFIYQILKANNHITTGMTPDFALVERLDIKYDKDVFDIVHMKNALDHSFNPIIGILQMLNVCKIGGKVILKHARNEAENESYAGLHQWNLCIENSSFIAWRPQQKYNLTEILCDLVDFQINDNPEEVHFTVVMSKRREIPPKYLSQFRFDTIFFEKIFNKLSNLILSDIYTKKSENRDKLKHKLKKTPILGYLAKQIYRTYNKIKNTSR